jgi:hypothetical protein
MRERLIKIGARVIEHTARIRIHLPSSCPELHAVRPSARSTTAWSAVNAASSRGRPRGRRGTRVLAVGVRVMAIDSREIDKLVHSRRHF